ncbi:NMT1-domain-containing protein [Dissoconium aciculare CBS 342.82]|uniref:4-amino-5-hydroxymethyl-2-methylpyrimidine phosphate synthase n=1 Tax=Dissoconium aciculare CBS 342.82 TaxID=1314786 RepID=A0A6J3LVI6_9PEZI|nr:NMT1-domain-containing protein [Dissoconium aciculare CBS 342.82]KAF1819771.1 NMT1-domain-containing protein [Dissoconium aciculare CBS 342.82]
MASTTIKIALDWTPNTIHSDRGLDVEILSPDAEYTKTPAKRLEAGEVDLAICPSESCIAYNETGKMPLQAIYVILQRDASAIASTHLGSMRGLSGKKYGSYNARYEDAIVKAMVTHDGGEGSAVEIVQSEGKLTMFEALLTGRVDATWIFLPWEGVEAESKAIKLNHFPLKDFDIPYGYSPVIARNKAANLSPETLKAFLSATQQGFQHSIDHPEDAVEALHEHCEPQRSREFLRASQTSINQFYAGDEGSLGTMAPAKWNAWIKWLVERELIKDSARVQSASIFTNEFIE